MLSPGIMALARWPGTSPKVLCLVAMRGALVALLLVAAGCVVPDVDRSIAASDAGPGKPRIVGADGPLTAGQGQVLLISIAGGAGQDELLHRHRAVEEAIAGTPL